MADTAFRSALQDVAVQTGELQRRPASSGRTGEGKIAAAYKCSVWKPLPGSPDFCSLPLSDTVVFFCLCGLPCLTESPGRNVHKFIVGLSEPEMVMPV